MDSSNKNQLTDRLKKLSDANDLYALLENPKDSCLRQEIDRLLMMSLGQIYPLLFQSSPTHPDFVPYLNNGLAFLQSNPDNVYLASALEDGGTYRISGNRGSVHICSLNLCASSGSGLGLWIDNQPGPNVGELDLNNLVLEQDGGVELIISRERPIGNYPNWMFLPEGTQHIVVRQTSYDWAKETDARLAIERLDHPVCSSRQPPDAISQNLDRAVNYARRVTEFFLIYMKNLRENRTINSIKTTALWNSNGIAKQVYFDGPWQLEEHEALIIETAIPERCRYWNLQLADPLSCGIDPLNRQTSLNGFQAELDSDGKFRAIIAGSDPGVPNWLDTGNYGYGSMLGRWLDADSSPQPSVRKVALNEVRDYLPKDTPTVSAEERDNRLRARRKAAQLRRRW